MNNLDKQYFDLLEDILSNGTQKGDRTGTGNISVFGRMIRHKMSEGFPLITTKKVYFKGVLVELLWFLKGGTNIKYMVDNDCNIWVGDAYKKFQRVQTTILKLKPPTSDEALAKYIDWYKNIKTKEDFIRKIKTDDSFAEKHGELGPVYGKQWRDWEGNVPLKIDGGQGTKTSEIWSGKFNRIRIDQIKELIEKLRNNPEDRRMIVNAWNVHEIPTMTLPPCHYSFQVYVRPLSLEERREIWNKKVARLQYMLYWFTPKTEDDAFDKQKIPRYEISLMFNLRSSDVPLGLPFNLASYGLLLEILAKHVNMVPGELIASIGDTHIYLNQVPMIKEQLERESFPLPTIKIADRPISDISEYEIEDFELVGYQSQSAIKIPLSN
jgi:thymidylate synthase